GPLGALVCIRDLPPAAPTVKPLESFFQVILEHIPVAVFIKDMRNEFRLIRVNREYEKVYGVQRERVLGKNVYDLLSGPSADFSIRMDRSIAEKGEILDIPEEYVTFPHAGERVLHTVKGPLKDDNGEGLYLLCMMEDITEKKRAEETRQKEHVWRDAQQELRGVIQELSTPVIPVHEGILVVPLVGRVDT